MVDSAHLFPKRRLWQINSLPTSGHYKANYENFRANAEGFEIVASYMERDGILPRRLYPNRSTSTSSTTPSLRSRFR
jgi:hypothetical protein